MERGAVSADYAFSVTLIRQAAGRGGLVSHLTYGVIAGVAFGVLAVLSMLKLTFPDKRAALMAAFLDRFGIGLVIGVVGLSWPSWIVGLVFGLLLSTPSAIITKAWAPIMLFGAVGGLVIGLIMPHVVP
jgi:hypothetical protein